MKNNNNKMKIECIKGFMLSLDSSLGIMAGEVFEMDPDSKDGYDFIGLLGGCRYPGMEISFTEEVLVNNFIFKG